MSIDLAMTSGGARMGIGGGAAGVGLGAGAGVADRQRSFAAVLGRDHVRADAARTPAQRARAAAERLTALVFVQPILEQFRRSSSAPPPLGAGSAEKQLRGLADAELSQQIVRAARFPLVQRLEADLLRASGVMGGSA